MSISDMRELIKTQLNLRAKDLFVLAVIILVGVGSFALGRLEGLEVFLSTPSLPIAPETTVGAQIGAVVASKTATKYYFPWCGVARNIKEDNKVWFNSVQAARAAGYTPGNCKGLN